MSRPGRGFPPRGSSTPYRGRGSSEHWNSSRGRGSFTGRGRFSWFKENPSGFESRKYSGSSGERFSSRGRGEDSGYRRSYNRPDGGYTGRDHHVHRSPDPSRKRMRSESFGSQASSSRRSHEGSYSGGGSDYNSRYNYPDDKNGGYGDDRGRYRDERRPPNFRDHSREDYVHRKPESMMPPPSRHMSPPRSRGTFRGRISLRGARGMTRILQARRNDSLIARKRFSDTYAMRKQSIAAKVQNDAWRKLKIQKLRSRLALTREANKADKEPSEEGEAEDDDEEDVDKLPAEEELEEGETVDKAEPPLKKKKIKQEKLEEPEEGEDLDDEEEKNEPTGEGGVQITIKHNSDLRDVSEDSRLRPAGNLYRRHFIKLMCPHCHHRCATFKDYTIHLYSAKHVTAMRKLSLQHKQRLVSMRVTQRQEQRLLEEAEEIEGVLAIRTNFCHICKLNYRQMKTKHMLSDSHRRMKKFLTPFCRVCRVAYKSPMLYENHLSSLEHLRRKDHIERQMQEAGGNASGSEVDSDDKDIDKYMTLDSVGIVDAEEDEVGEEDGEVGKEKGEEKKAEVNPGSEYLRKVEVYFCDLCKLYLPRLDQLDRAISIHCTSRNHLQRYVHFRNDCALRKKAELIHIKESAEKIAEAKKTADANVVDQAANGVPAPAVEATTPSEADLNSSDVVIISSEKEQVAPPPVQTVDEKLWDEVDRDLGDLLDQVLPESKGSSDEEDEADGGRYDRFRYTSREQSKGEPGSEDAGVVKVEDPVSEEPEEKVAQEETPTTEPVPETSADPEPQDAAENAPTE